MDKELKNKLLRTAGWATMTLGLYMVHLGSKDALDMDPNIIDAVFEVIDED